MKTLALFVAFSTLVFFGCATTTTTSNADSYIRTATARFQDAFNRNDWNSVASYYTDDAVMLLPNTDAQKGRAAIRAGLTSMAGMSPNLHIMPERIVQSGDLAYETGTYTMAMTPSGGTTMNDRGKYLTVWRRQTNGDWKIVADMINTSMPAPPM